MGRMAKKARGEHTPKIYWSVGQNLVKFDGSANLLVARRGSYICPRLYLPPAIFARICPRVFAILWTSHKIYSKTSNSRCAGRVPSILLEIHEVSGNTCSTARAPRTLEYHAAPCARRLSGVKTHRVRPLGDARPSPIAEVKI